MLDSVLNQKGPLELEVLVLDCGSTDNTVAIAREYEDKFRSIVRVRRSPHESRGENLRDAILTCTGEFIGFCNGDDYWLSERKLARQLLFLLRKPDHSMCFNWSLIDAADGSMFPDGEEALISGEEVSVPHIATSPTMAALSSCFYRTPAARGIPAEVYEAASLPDWLFNIHIAQAGRVGFMRETTSAIRYHEQGSGQVCRPTRSVPGLRRRGTLAASASARPGASTIRSSCSV
jgi:glycosyltransferase involved in cell wall biosynthesis